MARQLHPLALCSVQQRLLPQGAFSVPDNPPGHLVRASSLVRRTPVAVGFLGPPHRAAAAGSSGPPPQAAAGYLEPLLPPQAAAACLGPLPPVVADCLGPAASLVHPLARRLGRACSPRRTRNAQRDGNARFVCGGSGWRGYSLRSQVLALSPTTLQIRRQAKTFSPLAARLSCAGRRHASIFFSVRSGLNAFACRVSARSARSTSHAILRLLVSLHGLI